MKTFIRSLVALAVGLGILAGTAGAASADHWPVRPGPCPGSPTYVIEVPDDGDPALRICVYA